MPSPVYVHVHAYVWTPIRAASGSPGVYIIFIFEVSRTCGYSLGKAIRKSVSLGTYCSVLLSRRVKR